MIPREYRANLALATVRWEWERIAAGEAIMDGNPSQSWGNAVLTKAAIRRLPLGA